MKSKPEPGMVEDDEGPAPAGMPGRMTAAWDTAAQ